MKYFMAAWLPLTFSCFCILLGSFFALFYVLAIFGIFDLKSRIIELRKLKNKKFNTRTAYLFRVSRCQRNMMIGKYGKEAKIYFKSLGYRWWMFIPDMLLNNPRRFFTYDYIKMAYFK